MEIEKVKGVITSLCLFICSGFLFCFLLVLLYSGVVFIFEEHSLTETLTRAFLTPGLICMAFASLFYTLRSMTRCKSSNMEYVVADNSSSKMIEPRTPIISLKLVQDKGLVEISALISASVVAWTLTSMLLMIILIDGIGQDLVVIGPTGLGRFQVLLLVCDIVMFLLALLLSVSCICSIIAQYYCRRGTNYKVVSSPTSSSVETDEQPSSIV